MGNEATRLRAEVPVGRNQQHQQLPTSSCLLERQLLKILLDMVCPQMDWTLENKRMLVVGCGNGEVMLQALSPRLPPDATVVAADHRDDLLEQAKTRFDQPRLHFVRLDIDYPDIEESPAWSAGPYSKVFSFFYLQSIHEQNQALENIYKMLIPGGEVVLVLVMYTAVDALYQALARSSLWEQYVEDYREFLTPYQLEGNPEEVLQSYLEEAGFHIKHCSFREAILASRHDEVIREGVKATNFPHDRLPDELRNLYLQECMEELRASGKIYITRRGLYTYKYKALVAHAVKR